MLLNTGSRSERSCCLCCRLSVSASAVIAALQPSASWALSAAKASTSAQISVEFFCPNRPNETPCTQSALQLRGAEWRGRGRKFTDERYMSKSKKEKYLPCDNREPSQAPGLHKQTKDLELVSRFNFEDMSVCLSICFWLENSWINRGKRPENCLRTYWSS